MSDREKIGLRGPAARVRTEHFDCNLETDEVSAKPKFAEIVAYDLEGRTTSITHENQDGSSGTTWFTYNDRGDLEKKSSEWGGRQGQDTVYHYDESARLLRLGSVYQDGPERESACYTYEPDGSKTEVRFGLSPAEREKFIHEVKTRAQNTGTEIGYDLPPATTTIRYDPEGKPLEELQHDDNQILLSRIVYTYDDQGRLVEQRHEIGHKAPFSPSPDDPSMGPLEREALEKMVARLFAPGADMERTTFVYDDQGRKIEEIRQQGPFGATRTTSEYDEHGNTSVVRSAHESREFQLTADGDLDHPTEANQTTSTNFFQYQYDERGNWTEKRSLFVDPSNGKSKCLMAERRTITYW